MRITVSVTPAELERLGLWSRVCKEFGLSDQTVSEKDAAKPIVLSGDLAVQIGLITVQSERVPSETAAKGC